MLPSRGIARSLSSANAQRQSVAHRAPTRTLGNARQLSTVRRTLGNGLVSSATASARVRYGSAPIALGGVASMRTFSLWGYGKKAAPAEDSLSSAATSTPPTENVVPDHAIESAAASSNAPASTTEVISDAAHSIADKASTQLSSVTSEISDIVNGTTASEILSRPETLGYLKSLGLDYGWGFTSTMQWVVEHVHVYTGLGWPGTIIATAVLLRVALFYPQMKATIFSTKMAKMQADPRYTESIEMSKEGLITGDRAKRESGNIIQQVLRKEHNVPLSDVKWSLLPIPLSYGFFRLLTGMVSVPVPGLETSFLWLPSLVQSDPYFILPLLTSGFMVASITASSKTSTEKQRAMMSKAKYIITPIMLIGTSFLSSAVNLMGVSLGLCTYLSLLLLHNPTFRRLTGMPKPFIPPPATPEAGAVRQEPRKKPETLREKITTNVEDMRQGMKESVAKFTQKAGQATSEEEKAKKAKYERIQKIEKQRADQRRADFEAKYKNKN